MLIEVALNVAKNLRHIALSSEEVGLAYLPVDGLEPQLRSDQSRHRGAQLLSLFRAKWILSSAGRYHRSPIMQPQRREAAPHQLDFVMRVDDLVNARLRS